MNTLSPAKKLVLTAVCIALCVVVPIAFHAIPNAGSVFLPMHLPVLLCGMLCGWPFGGVCGLMGPALSSLITGMPAAAILPAMTVECTVYGITAGFLMDKVRTGHLYADLYLSLIPAMVLGRVVSGVAKAWILAPGITLVKWATVSFVTGLPGIIMQLLLVPAIILSLTKAKLISERYAR